MATIKTNKTKEDWAKSRGQKLVGTPLKPSHAARIYYQNALKKAVDRMRKDYQNTIDRELKPAAKMAAQDSVSTLGASLLFLDKKWGGVFSKLSRKLANNVVGKVDKAAELDLNGSLASLSGLAIKTPKLPQKMIGVIQAATRVNVDLIRSIQSQYHDKVFQAIMPNIGDAQQIKGEAQRLVSKVYFIGETVGDRAALIASDQTRKLSSAINVARMKSAGVKRGQWMHSGGSLDPRDLHVQYDGQIFDLDDPPIIDAKTGERGWPGQLLNCRCALKPVIIFDD